MEAQPNTEETCPRAWRWGHLFLLLAVAGSWLVLSLLNVWMGELNQDEGWYLYAARQITQGYWPYRDYAFTQPPLLPLVYSAVFPWIEHFGLLGGRMLTWVFSVVGLLSTVWLALRTGPRTVKRLTAGACLILVAVNLYQSYFTTVVKTYALSGMFLSAGLLALSLVGRRSGFRAATAAGFLLACATATRISMGAALALGGLYLLAVHRQVKGWAWLDYALGGGLGLALTLLPFVALGGEGFRFGIVEYHTLRESGPWLSQAAYKIGCLSRLVQAYFPAAVGGVFLLAMAVRHVVRCGAPVEGTAPAGPMPVQDDVPPGFLGFLWVVVLGLGLVHWAAPFPYDDYQVPVYSIYCAALAATGARWWLRVEKRRFAAGSARSRAAKRLSILTILWLVCGLHAFSSPLAQGWFVAGRDRIWWRLREQSPVAQLQDMGKWVRDLTLAEGGTELLTQDTYLAVEAGLSVPRGLEMGPFSYYPEWTRARAGRVGVMNRDMMIELLSTATNAPIAAFSGYSLSIRSPEVEAVSREDQMAFEEIIRERFDPVESVPGFGQAGTTLEIWRLKKDMAEPGAPEEAAEE